MICEDVAGSPPSVRGRPSKHPCTHAMGGTSKTWSQSVSSRLTARRKVGVSCWASPVTHPEWMAIARIPRPLSVPRRRPPASVAATGGAQMGMRGARRARPRPLFGWSRPVRRPLQPDADAQPVRPWRSRAGRYSRVPALGGITPFAQPDAGAPSRRPSSVAATAGARMGTRDGRRAP